MFVRFVGANASLEESPRLALLLLLSVGGLKVWTTIRDIERLGLNRMALEDKAILTVPDVQEAPESLGAPDDLGSEHRSPRGRHGSGV